MSKERISGLLRQQKASEKQMSELKKEINRVRNWAVKDNNKLDRILANIDKMVNDLDARLQEQGKELEEFRKEFLPRKESGED